MIKNCNNCKRARASDCDNCVIVDDFKSDPTNWVAKAGYIMAIDPGTTQSGYVIFDIDNKEFIDFGKASNEWLLELTRYGNFQHMAIEMITSYGKPVGQSTFDTCRIIGRLEEIAFYYKIESDLIPRRFIKKVLGCKNDSEIIQAMKYHWGEEKTKGFTRDAWSALAVLTVWLKDGQ